MHVLGVVASPSKVSRTQTLVEAVLHTAEGLGGVTTEVVTLASLALRTADGTAAEQYGGDTGWLLAAIDDADALVFGMPIFRGTYPGSLKNLLDMVPRGGYDGDAPALRAKPVAIAATGASDHHFLATGDLGSMLCGFFSAYVVPPGLYATHEDFRDGGLSSERVRVAANRTGRALVELCRAIASSRELAAVEPMV